MTCLYKRDQTLFLRALILQAITPCKNLVVWPRETILQCKQTRLFKNFELKVGIAIKSKETSS